MKKAIYMLGLCMCVEMTMAQNQTASNKELKRERKETEQMEKLKQEHLKWEGCILVEGKDSIHLCIKPKDIYSNAKPCRAEEITVVDESGQESTVQPEEYSAFIIFRDTETVKFVSIPVSGYNCNVIYKVQVDGQCQLLSTMIVLGGGVAISGMVLPIPPNSEIYYYIRYRNRITEIGKEDMMGTSLLFKRRCRKIFADYPALVEKIENKTYGPDDLRQIVKEFNQYIANNPAAQTKK